MDHVQSKINFSLKLERTGLKSQPAAPKSHVHSITYLSGMFLAGEVLEEKKNRIPRGAPPKQLKHTVLLKTLCGLTFFPIEDFLESFLVPFPLFSENHYIARLIESDWKPSIFNCELVSVLLATLPRVA